MVFSSRKRIHSFDVTFKDFILPDFKIEVKLKDQSLPDSLKFFFEISTTLDKFETEVVGPDDIKTTLKGQSDYFKHLSKKVDLKPLLYVFENFFLYDLENMIKETFVTELNKEFSIYGLITFSGENKDNKKLNLINPSNNLKFEVKKDTYKTSISFALRKKKHEENCILLSAITFLILVCYIQRKIKQLVKSIKY